MLDTLATIDPAVNATGLRPAPKRMRTFTKANIAEDLRLVLAGTMDLRSALQGYRKFSGNSVEVIVRDKNGRIKSMSRQHNLRTTQGRDNLQRLQMFGDITANATSYTGVSGAATTVTATSLTAGGSPAFPTSGGGGVGGLQGHIVVCMAAGVPGVYGVIMSNTSSVLTIDQWYSATSAVGAAGSTPGNTSEYFILPWAGMALWIGLSTDTTTPAAADVLRTSGGLFGNGTVSGGSATEQTANQLGRAFVQPTFPGAGQVQLQNTWSYTGSSSVTIAKVVLCNSLAAAGSLLFLDTLLNATATVTTSGDQIQVTWTINL
jgi:hypothetical protein